jgi:hypothetical protein
MAYITIKTRSQHPCPAHPPVWTARASPTPAPSHRRRRWPDAAVIRKRHPIHGALVAGGVDAFTATSLCVPRRQGWWVARR